MVRHFPCRAYPAQACNALEGIFKKLDSNMDSAKKILTMLTPQYQSATLSVEHTGQWRFSFYCYHPQTKQLERIRKTFKINRIKDQVERKRVAELYITTINTALRNGYNYWIDTVGLKIAVADPLQPVVTIEPPKTSSLIDALNKALKIRVLGKKKRTAASYSSFVGILTEWLTENNLAAMSVTEFTADHFQQFLFHKSSLGHKNENLNEHLSFNKTTFDVIRKNLKLIKENPIKDMQYLPESESRLFQPLTPQEIQRIVPVLLEHDPKFYLYTKFIPDEYIRPYHIARLKISDIDFQRNTITVGGTTSKNKKNAQKQLLPGIKELLIKMEYHKLPGHYYLFGRKFEASATLYPSLSTRACELWKKLIIDGLGINKKMYALKHTAMQYFVNENDNVDVYYLRQQAEHHSAAMTEVYLQKNVNRKIDPKKTKTIEY